MATIKEQCLGSLVAALTGVKVANGYLHTLKTVQRFQPLGQPSQDSVNFPAVYLTEGSESAEDMPYGCATKTLRVALDVATAPSLHEDHLSGAALCTSLEAEIERAVLADRSRGGFALDTFYDGREEARLVEDEEAVLAFRMNLRVQYRHKAGDPYTVV